MCLHCGLSTWTPQMEAATPEAKEALTHKWLNTQAQHRETAASMPATSVVEDVPLVKQGEPGRTKV